MKKIVHVVSNFMNVSFCSSGDLCMHHECSPTYFFLLKSSFFLSKKIIKLLIQSDIIPLVTPIAIDTAQKYTPYMPIIYDLIRVCTVY